MGDWLGELRSDRLDELASSKIVHITSLLDDHSAEELGRLVDDLSKAMYRGIISFDPGHNWIVKRLPLVRRILRNTDLLFLNEDELGILAGREGDPPCKELAARVLDMMAPTSKIIVLKSAAQVTCFVLVGGECVTFEFPNTKLQTGQLHNPVGTGDAMAAGYLASLLTKSSHFGPVALGQRIAAARLLLPNEQEYHKRAELEFKKLTRSLEQIENGFGSKIFIGHGGTTDWIELDRFLSKRLGLETLEFEDVPNPGKATVERIDEMLNTAGFAFLVMTGEDKLKNGDLQARPNVMHEVGLFHGKLGRHRAIVLLEDDCEEFSNIHGLQQVRFTKGKIAEKFEKIRATLEREGLVSSGKAISR